MDNDRTVVSAKYINLLHLVIHFEGEEADTAAQVVDIDMVGNMGSTPAASTVYFYIGSFVGILRFGETAHNQPQPSRQEGGN